MKRFAEWMIGPAVAVAVVTGAHAQVLAPDDIGLPVVVSDLNGPYAAMPPDVEPEYGGPRLLPPREVYTVVRDNGFSPLSAPRQRGFVYTIAVINPDGDDGRLLIDARNGRIVRFIPAEWTRGPRADLSVTYGPVGPPPVVIEARRGPPRPPAPIPQRYASRTPSSIPLPRPAPHAVVAPNQLAAKPKPAAPQAQQSAAVETKSGEAKPAAAKPSAATPVEAKPSVTIEPTQEMPAVQGLD